MILNVIQINSRIQSEFAGEAARVSSAVVWVFAKREKSYTFCVCDLGFAQFLLYALCKHRIYIYKDIHIIYIKKFPALC